MEQAKTAQSHLMKKIPANSEAAAILVAQDENIDVSTLALVRMLDSQVFDGFLEVPIPLRFLCFFIGPVFSQHDFHEMGRAMGTLFSDEVGIKAVILTISNIMVTCVGPYKHNTTGRLR